MITLKGCGWLVLSLMILLLRVMGNRVSQELRTASAQFLKDFWKVCQLNIGRRSAECHWDSYFENILGILFCLLTEPRTSQTRNYHGTAWLEVVIPTAVFFFFFYWCILSYVMSFLCDQEMSIWYAENQLHIWMFHYFSYLNISLFTWQFIIFQLKK